MKIVIEMGRNLYPVSEPTISMGRIIPVYKPSEAELNACPDTFTCYACLEKRPKAQLGNRVSGQWICRFCRPYFDEYGVNLLVRFDERQVVKFGSVKRKGRLDDVVPEHWQAVDTVDLILLRLQGIEDTPEFIDAYNGDPIQPSEKKALAIKSIRLRYEAWLKTRR